MVKDITCLSFYLVLTNDCKSMWLVISLVLLICVYLLIWLSCSLVNFGKNNFFAVYYLKPYWNLVLAIIHCHFFYLTTSLSQSIFIVFRLYCHLCLSLLAHATTRRFLIVSVVSIANIALLINIWQCALFMLGQNGIRNKQWDEIEIWRQMEQGWSFIILRSCAKLKLK